MATSVQYQTSLIPWADPVMHQGNEGACGGCMINNGIGLISNLLGQHFEANAQIVYNMNLVEMHCLGQDVGVNPKLFMDLLTTKGVTESTDIDYGIQSIAAAPTAYDYVDAATHTISGYIRLPVDGVQETRLAHQIAEQLLQGKPLFQAFQVTAAMEAEAGPLSQQSGNNFGPSIGGHFAEVVAIDTTTNMETLATWGTQYGDHGYFQVSLDSFYTNAAGGNPLNLQEIYSITGFNGVDLRQTDNTALTAEAFIAILDRAPALGGMRFYSAQLDGGATLASVCDEVLATSEAQGVAGALSNDQFVQMLFGNVLGRAAAAGGLAFYSGELAAGATRGHVAAELITAGADRAEWQDGLFFGDGSIWSSVHNPDPNIYSESLLFQNKAIAAQDFAITLQAGAGHLDVARSLIDAVTVDPGSIWGVALVGVPEQLGHAHIDGAAVS